MQEVSRWERKIVEADTEEFTGEFDCLLDVVAVYFDVFDSVVVFQGLFHLVHEGYGFAEVEEFRLIPADLEAVVFIEEFFGVGIDYLVRFEQRPNVYG